MTIEDPLLFWPGLALLLLGWVLYWVALSTAMGVLCSFVAFTVAALATWLVDVQDPAHRIAILGGAAVLGMVAGVMLFRLMHRFAFLLVGACCGVAAGVALLEHLRGGSGGAWVHEAWAGLALGGGGALAGAALLSALDKYVVASISSVAGGVLVMMGTGWPFGGWPLVVLIPAGIAFQAGMGARSKRDARGDDEDEDDDED